MNRIIHNLIQGSPEWHQFRLEHDGASEAAAMLGLSKKVKRSELLAMKHTGIAKEFSDWVQENILDHGHEVEALARPIVDNIIGDQLYPVTCSLGRLSASCDGLTMDDAVAFEHKQWNNSLAASVKSGVLPEEHMPQCQQVLMVTGAESLIFVVSDGTAENMVWMMVKPDQEWFERIRAGWVQFHIDLDSYFPAEVVQEVIAKPTKDLPALSIKVEGSISLITNLDRFGAMLNAYIENIDKAPTDDQGFADAESAIKKLQAAQDALEAAESNALAQTSDIDAMRRTVKLYADTARNTRLMLKKMVETRKDTIRIEIAQKGKDDFAEHIKSLNTRLGKPYMPTIVADFAGVMKGKKTIASLRDAVATELARVKIESNAVADKIDINLKSLRELAKDHIALFADTSNIVLKSNDDLVNLINSRINEFKAAEEKKAEELRAKIQAEEQAKAEAKVRAEQEAKAQAEAAAALQARLAESQKIEDARQVELAGAVLQQRAADSNLEETHKALRDAIAIGTGVSLVTENGIKHVPIESVMAQPAPTTTPTLTLGKIGTRLGFNLSAEFMQKLGFEPKREKGAVLFHESDWPAICAALKAHIDSVSEIQKQAA